MVEAPLQQDIGNITGKSLAEQLQITEREIESRKRLLMLSDEDVKHLTDLREEAVTRVDAIVDDFYARQTNFPEITLLIGDSETLQRLRMAMRRYIIEIFEGYFDTEYVNKRLRIGKVHKRIGVPPKLYVSAVHLLESLLIEHVIRPPGEKLSAEAQFRTVSALRKVLMFDLQLVFDTYIASMMNEVESAKQEVEDYARSLEETVEARTRELKELSSRDSLTGLVNQRAFYEQLRFGLSLCARQSQPLTLAYFDLNGFKKLNDHEGHRAGDKVLAKVGQDVRRTIRDHDIAARYGGDEFAVILLNTGAEGGKVFSRRLIEAFGKEDTQGISFAIGLAESTPEAPLSADEIVKAADGAMYRAKRRSKTEPGFHVECAETADAGQGGAG